MLSLLLIQREILMEANIKNAEKYMTSGDFKRATVILKKIIDKSSQPDGQVNVMYLKALYMSNQFETAYKFLSEDPNEFYSNAETQELAVKVLIANHNFIEARMTLNKMGRNQALFKQLKTAEIDAENNQSQTNEQLLNSFYHMGDQNIWDQQKVLQNAEKLPLNMYLKGVKLVLRDPFIKQIIKSSIVENMISLKINEELTIYWIDDQEHQFLPSKLEPLEKDKLSIKLIKMLKSDFKDKPTEFINYMKILQLQLLYLIPFTDKIITDQRVWLDVLEGQADLSQSLAKDAQHWQNIITKQNNNLI